MLQNCCENPNNKRRADRVNIIQTAIDFIDSWIITMNVKTACDIKDELVRAMYIAQGRKV